VKAGARLVAAEPVAPSVVHLVRDPYDTAISSYLYHSQVCARASWSLHAFDIARYSYSARYLVLVPADLLRGVTARVRSHPPCMQDPTPEPWVYQLRGPCKANDQRCVRGNACTRFFCFEAGQLTAKWQKRHLVSVCDRRLKTHQLNHCGWPYIPRRSQAFLADTLKIPASALSNVFELYLELYHSATPGGRAAVNYFEAMRAHSVEDAVRAPPPSGPRPNTQGLQAPCTGSLYSVLVQVQGAICTLYPQEHKEPACTSVYPQ
jgi:hypothetical protein